MKNTAILFAACLTSAILAIAGYRYFEPRSQPLVIRETIPPAPVQTSLPTSPNLPSGSVLPIDFTEAARRSTPAVVNIKADQRFDLWMTNRYSGSSGSGVIISPEGYLLTNNHVIEEGNRYDVTLHDRREFEAELIGTDPTTDLALLKLKNPDQLTFPFVRFGDSDSLQIGEWVLAVGNPFNLTSTVTAGIVSAKGRSIDILDDDYRIESFIQTDAAVNPGNSGGALVNLRGQLVGINTAIITRSGKYEGYSFAVPANLAAKVVGDLQDFGTVQRGLLGVSIDPVDQALARQLDLQEVRGVYLRSVNEGSGAEAGGLRSGDVILRINDFRIKDIPALQEVIGRFRPGNTVHIRYMRDGQLREAEVELRDQDNKATPAVAGEADVIDILGFELRDLNREEYNRLRTGGVFVEAIRPNSIIEKTDMSPGYIITKVNKRRISTVAELQESIRKGPPTVLLEGFYEDFEGAYYYTFNRAAQ